MDSPLVTVFGVLLILFLVGRVVVLWYFRINEQVALLKEIRDSLAAMQPAAAPVTSTPPPPLAAESVVALRSGRTWETMARDAER